jgi:hypothetical protein
VSRSKLDTGKKHQVAVSTWARKRLADRAGREFDDGVAAEPAEQIGCLFADGVGLGKTWEALAAIALLLDKREWRRRRQRAERGRQRVNQRRQEAHVLILLPPGLVAKWWRELHNPERSGFPRRLKRWAKKRSRRFVARTLAPENTFVIRRRSDLADLPRGSTKRGRYVLPPGTYLCNWNVFLSHGGRGLDRVTALKNQRWDVVVVDEAHHGRARAALTKFKHSAYTILLTATPFQLDMTELHGLTRHLLEGHAPQHRVLKRGAVKVFAKAADRAFDGGERPTSAERREAQAVLRQLVACSDVGRQRREYYTIGARGQLHRIRPPTELEQRDLPAVFGGAIDAGGHFEDWYLRERLGLARHEAGERPKHIAVELRKLLSVRRPPSPTSPRLAALATWARSTFAEDLRCTLRDGIPRKLLLFTHLKTGVASAIMRTLEEALEAAYKQLSRSPAWRAMRAAADNRLQRVLSEVREHTTSERLLKRLDRFEAKIRGTLYHDLFGNPRFARRAARDLVDIVRTEVDMDALRDVDGGDERVDWYEKQARAKQRTARAVFDALSRSPLAATFTGDDSRVERDAMAEAFKTALAPWILVATNVGSEGIDLHTYSRHLVHFDLEWNPARMEQREGRIDRLGRALKEPARVYYLLVKDTYDERMFHQLIARQRWHGVLLGRKALQLGVSDDNEAEMLSAKDARSMSLDLDPRHA